MGAEVKNRLALGLSALTLILVFLLFASCAIIAYLALAQPAEGGDEGTAPDGSGASGGTDNETAPAGEPTRPNATSEDLGLWNNITEANVEAACLRIARDEAGSSANLVYGCDCEGEAGLDRKTYSCSISTADPFTDYFANVDCFLEDSACTVETNYGTLDVTFDEIRKWSEN